MARKVTTGNTNSNYIPSKPGKVKLSKTVSWKRGKRSSKTTYVNVDKHGSVSHIEKSGTFNLFGFIVLVLVGIFLVRFLAGVSTNDITFMSFLDFLTTVPQIDISAFLDYTMESLTAPDWLGFLGTIWNFLVDALNIVAFLAIGLVNAITFVL